MIVLPVLEQIIDRSGVALRIEAMLPIGVRGRQLRVRTLLAGMCLALADHRPAHLTRVHHALTGLPEAGQVRLGVAADWKHGQHLLTCRQTERTFGLVADALAEDEPGGLPSEALAGICGELLEASVPDQFKDASTSLAVDWTDLESFSRPPPAKGGPCADPEASWGHRRNNLPGPKDELFYGYYFSSGIMMPDENSPAVPELARRATVSSCRHDPVRALVPVLTRMPAAGAPLGDILADSGYAHRDAEAWAIPLRAAGASLIQDLHPHDLFRTKECGPDGSDVIAGQGTAWDAQGQAGVALTSSNEEEAGEPFSTGCPLSVVPGPRSRHLRPADRDIPVRVVTAAMIIQSSELR